MTFVWMATGKELNFTDWDVGQPDNTVCNNGLGVEHCLDISKHYSPDMKWNDELCVKENNFICEF